MFVATSALVQRVLAARRDLRLKRELAVLDGFDAVTNLVTATNPPIHPIPSAAPTAPGSASAMTTNPTNPPIHPIPSAAPTAPGSAPAMTTNLTNPPIHPIPSAAPTAPGPTYLPPTRTST
ncbi:MAG: hypothetical protein H6Q90_6676, partial [Deltaproteobacteria bacterium]|nr:hypothetical protein [Deltaproteobacteria bacterium]